MEIANIPYLWRQLSYTLTILLVFVGSGCGPRSYCFKGCESPPDELAVLTESLGVQIVAIDEHRVGMPGYREFVILPGRHTITARYSEPMWDYVAWGEELTRECLLEKGRAYLAQASAPILPFSRKYLEENQEGQGLRVNIAWDMQVQPGDTLEESAAESVPENSADAEAKSDLDLGTYSDRELVKAHGVLEAFIGVDEEKPDVLAEDVAGLVGVAARLALYPLSRSLEKADLEKQRNKTDELRDELQKRGIDPHQLWDPEDFETMVLVQ